LSFRDFHISLVKSSLNGRLPFFRVHSLARKSIRVGFESA
jgi:hypothetical protein